MQGNVWPYIGLLIIPLGCSSLFAEQYNDPKWAFIYGITSLATLRASVSKETRLEIPLLGRSGGVLFFGLVSSYLLSMICNLPGFYENQLLDWTCFIVLTVLAYNSSPLEQSLLFQWNLIATLGVLIYGVLQWMGLDPFPSLVKNEFPSSFFGFQNMTAEFIGLSCLVQTYSLIVCWENRKKHGSWPVTRSLVFFLSLYYLWILGSRAAILSLLCAFIFGVLFYPVSASLQKRMRTIAIVLSTLMGAMLLTYTSASFFRPSWIPAELIQTKSQNTKIRLARWKNTLEMMKDHPMGVGPGKFEFAYVPYRYRQGIDFELDESNLVRSPHNGYLQIGAQSGVFTLFLCITFLLFLAWAQKGAKPTHERVFILSAGVWIGVDAIFAFPMETAYPFFFSTLILGRLLRQSTLKRWTIPPKIKNIALLSVGLVLISLGSLFFVSKLTEGAFGGNYSLASWSCKTFPSNWRVCVQKAEIELNQDRPDLAETTASRLLRSSPTNFVALKILGDSLLRQGRQAEGCQYLTTYHELFQKKHSLRDFIAEQCGT